MATEHNDPKRSKPQFEGAGEQELTRLFDAIRAEGTPYANVDERYFGSFRRRVMERIEAEELRALPWYSKVGEWFKSSPIRTGIIGLSTAAAIALAVVSIDSTQPAPPIAARTSTRTDHPSVSPETPANYSENLGSEAPLAGSNPVPSRQTPNSTTESLSASAQTPIAGANESITKLAPKSVATDAPQTGSQNIALMQQVPTTSDVAALETDGPVSIDDLSAADLEGLLASLENTN